MTHNTDVPNNTLTRLTALWALNESGLGGILFALHIPLTGFFVGGFAVILISLIAFYSKNNYRSMIRATVLVLIIKASASPQAPLPAYFAVAFQGISGALIFSGIRNHKLAALLLAVLAMVESALQKIIFMTLIYGKSIWMALDKSMESIAKDFSINERVSYSYRIIGAYVLIHVFWGFLIGIFAGRLPKYVHKHTGTILKHHHDYSIQYTEKNKLVLKRKWKGRHLLRFMAILLFIVSVFLFSGSYSEYKIIYVIIRSVAAILLLFFVLKPIITRVIQYWLKKQHTAIKQEAINIMAMMPALRNNVKSSWSMAKANTEKMGKFRYFILSVIILSLHGK